MPLWWASFLLRSTGRYGRAQSSGRPISLSLSSLVCCSPYGPRRRGSSSFSVRSPPPSSPASRRMVKQFLCASFLFLSVSAAHAADTVFLEELTWTELRDAISAGKTTIIVPIGGTEQSGPQIVLGKHNVRARVLAGRTG